MAVICMCVLDKESRRMLRKTTFAVAALILAFCAGCQSHAERKQAVKEQWQKSSSQIKLGLAKQQYENGKYADALKNIEECVSADADNAEAHLVYGKILMAQGNRSKAEQELHVAVELDDALDEGWYWLGVGAQEGRQIRQARGHYEKAMALSPGNVDYVLAVAECYGSEKRFEAGCRVLESSILSMPREISLKVAAADMHSRAGNNARAISLYEEAMLLASDDEGIAESLGYCYMFADKWAEGAAIFEQLAERLEASLAGEKDPEKSAENEQRRMLYFETAAVCNMRSGQYARAVECYNKLTVAKRYDAEVWVKMGQAALGAGMIGRARQCGERAYSLRPGYSDAMVLIGCAQYRGREYSAAEESFAKISSDKTAGGFAWLMRARCYEQLGQADRAKVAYKRALELDPESELGDYLAKGRGGRQW